MALAPNITTINTSWVSWYDATDTVANLQSPTPRYCNQPPSTTRWVTTAVTMVATSYAKRRWQAVRRSCCRTTTEIPDGVPVPTICVTPKRCSVTAGIESPHDESDVQANPGRKSARSLRMRRRSCASD